ncbi:MAG: type IV pilus twitching motility protein PilT, partial [Eubacterium sp.]|nr:type IV pilus twitching motility protein PilT [Eubacterium sp.]
EDQKKHLREVGDVDLAYSIPGFGRMRVNVFYQRGTLSMAIRVLSFGIPDCDELGIPEVVREMAKKPRGLILVTGATGCGKSTTLAALVGLINGSCEKHIITLEDPIEYLHRHGMSMVTQREIGLDSMSYASALRAALREDPDVIQVGEMRDLETISTVLTAAETGHLVFSTLHTNDAASAVDRVIDVFPPHQQQQARVQLADVIEGVVSQRLVPKADGSGRVAIFEIMTATNAVRNLIREGKTFQVPTIMQTGGRDGMITMDDALVEAVNSGVISAETAVSNAVDQNRVKQKVGN